MLLISSSRTADVIVRPSSTLSESLPTTSNIPHMHMHIRSTETVLLGCAPPLPRADTHTLAPKMFLCGPYAFSLSLNHAPS
jgi:hypothetical protein